MSNNLVDIKNRVPMSDVVSKFVALERVGDYWKGLCPFHPDKNTPSLVVYSDHAYCFGCRGHWDIFSFIQRSTGRTFPEAIDWILNNLSSLPSIEGIRTNSQAIDSTIPVPMEIIKYWHSMLTKLIRKYFYSRCLTDNTIDFYMLGWDGNNYVIPIWDGEPRNSSVFGVKFRRCEGSEGPKYFGLRGRNQPRLFNKWVLNGANEAFIFIGEFDALLAWQDGFPAVSTTGGQNAWISSWNHLFNQALKVWVLPDAGEVAAGYAIASNFMGKSTVLPFSEINKDYTQFRQRGNPPELLRNLCGGN